MPMARLLKVKRIDAVGFVDKGANEDADIVFWKRAAPRGPTDADKGDDMEKQDRGAIAKALDGLRKALMGDTGDEDMATIDLDQIPEEQRAAVEALQKQAEEAASEKETLEARVAELEALATPEEPDEGEDAPDPLAKADPGIRAEFEKLADRLEAVEKAKTDAEERVAKLEDERTLQAYIEKARDEFPRAGKPEDMGAMLKALDEGLDKDVAKRVREQLKAGHEAILQAGLFKSVGYDGEGEEQSAWAEVEKRAQALVEKGEAKTVEQARDAVMKRDRDLAKRVMAESH